MKQIVIDQDDLREPDQDEIKDGQWMGVTVKSQGRGGNVRIEIQ